jgi:hypothetical protein
MKKMQMLGVALGAWTAVASAAAVAAPAEWQGYVTDTHCGVRGASKDHTLKCVEKCMKSGSKAQLWVESEKKAYDLDGVQKVKDLVGTRVTVKGTLDPATNTITVESAAKTDAAAK